MSKPQLFVTEADEGLDLSAEEFAEADFQPPYGYERARRRIVVLPPPGHNHFVILEQIHEWLVTYKISHKDLVEHIIQESWYRIDEQTDRRPDLAVYLFEQSTAQQIPQRLPDIIFEIISPGVAARDRDYTQKRDEYERAGVREYVIVDRFERRMTVLRLEDGKYTQTLLADCDSYTTPLLPGLQIPLQGIL